MQTMTAFRIQRKPIAPAVPDTDSDGTPDFQDTDADNDGIPDSTRSR